jgi:hypothetical protein
MVMRKEARRFLWALLPATIFIGALPARAGAG